MSVTCEKVKWTDERSFGTWVLCSEDMPKEDEEVLITYKDDVVEAHYYEAGKTWCDRDEYEFARKDEVEAWMPKPKPYKKMSLQATEGAAYDYVMADKAIEERERVMKLPELKLGTYNYGKLGYEYLCPLCRQRYCGQQVEEWAARTQSKGYGTIACYRCNKEIRIPNDFYRRVKQ